MWIELLPAVIRGNRQVFPSFIRSFLLLFIRSSCSHAQMNIPACPRAMRTPGAQLIQPCTHTDCLVSSTFAACYLYRAAAAVLVNTTARISVCPYNLRARFVSATHVLFGNSICFVLPRPDALTILRPRTNEHAHTPARHENTGAQLIRSSNTHRFLFVQGGRVCGGVGAALYSWDRGEWCHTHKHTQEAAHQGGGRGRGGCGRMWVLIWSAV
jgi:hypothetical protein